MPRTNYAASARRIAEAMLPPEVLAHTLRVVARSGGDIVVAYLHDVVEDSRTTIQDLRDFGFNEATVEAVEVLTRDPLVTYAEYIERVRHYGGAARAVKIADLEDHLAEVDTLKPSLKGRYDRALAALRTAEGGR